MLILDSLGLTIYICIIAALLGAVMGSFLNCLAIRMLNGESILKGRSHCMSCNHLLGVADLIPVFSWLFLKGKCRYCGAKMSPRYFIAELVSALAFVGLVLKFGISLELLEFTVLCCLLLLVSFTDLEDCTIPDKVIIVGLVWRVVWVFLAEDSTADLKSALLGAVIISIPLLLVVLLMEKIIKKEAMGGGDFKLLIMVGSYFSAGLNLVAFIFACILGILFGLVFAGKGKKFPFGPSIAAGYFITLLIGEGILNWYLGLF